jgi:hypothetical protein
MGRKEKVDPSSLPALQKDWIARQKGKELCRHYLANGWCEHQSCCNMHVLPSLGLSYGFPYEGDHSALDRKSFNIGCEVDKHGRSVWFTAGYEDVDKKLVYLAEQGGGFPNESDVWWYRSSDEAQAALERVVLVARSRKRK